MSLGFNRSEEYGNKRKKLIPNPITYKNTEDKEVSKPRENPYQRCPECEDCDPSIPPVVGSTGTCRVGLLPDNIHQSIIEVDAEGNNLYFIYPNNKDAWSNLYTNLFDETNGRTDVIFIGEEGLVYENDPESGDLVGGIADGFAKAILEATNRKLYATPVYYGYEIVKSPTYDPLEPSTYNDPNPTGSGRVMLGTKNVYDSFVTEDNILPITGTDVPPFNISNSQSSRYRFGVFSTLSNNMDPTCYTLGDSRNTPKIYDDGERDNYLLGTYDTNTEAFSFTTLPYNHNSLNFSGRVVTPDTHYLYEPLLQSLQVPNNWYDSNTEVMSLCSEQQPDKASIQSYFSVNSIFENQTRTATQSTELWTVNIGTLTVLQDGSLEIDSFFNEAMTYGLVPPYLGKQYSPTLQGEEWQTGDDYEIASGQQKIQIQKLNNEYVLIYDPNTNSTINVTNTNIPYLNNIYPAFTSETPKSDIGEFGAAPLAYDPNPDNKTILTVSYRTQYYLKIRDPSFNWATYTIMPGYNDVELCTSRPTSWDIVPLVNNVTSSELYSRYQSTKIENLNSTNYSFDAGMPHAYQLQDSIHSTGWMVSAFPADYSRRIGPSVQLISDIDIENYYKEKRLNFVTEGMSTIHPYQFGLPVTSLFRLSKDGLLSHGSQIIITGVSNSGETAYGSQRNEHEFARRHFYSSSFYLKNGQYVSYDHNKSRRVTCEMKTGSYMDPITQSIAMRTEKEDIYTSSNFKYLVGYITPKRFATPSNDLNNALKDFKINLSITPEKSNGDLGTTIEAVHTTETDIIYTKFNFASLTANLSNVTEDYTKLNLSFLGYNTQNETYGDGIITTHSGIDVDNQNGIAFQVLSTENALRFADIEYSWRNGYSPYFLEMFRHIKERQTNIAHGGTNVYPKIVIYWLMGRQESGNDIGNGSAAYGGLQGQTYMSNDYYRFITKLVSIGYRPSDITVLFVLHPKAAHFSKQVTEDGTPIQNPLAYTSEFAAHGFPSPLSDFTKVGRSIFITNSGAQNPTGGFLKTKRIQDIGEMTEFIEQFRILNPISNKLEEYGISQILRGTPTLDINIYSRNMIFFDTSMMQGVININNRLTNDCYSILYDANDDPIICYKYLNAKGCLQFGRDMVKIMKGD